MASTHKSLRSGTANKRPTTSIADGQIALNTNTTSPGLFFKDSTGATIIKVGPVHVGTTAPNASPATGGSSGNSTGEVWLDNSLTPNGVKIWNGASWTNATPIGSTTVQGLLELATSAETQTGTDTDRAVTPAGLQSKVSDSTSTTSSTTIASSTAVKSAYDLANAALPKSGGTVTGNLEIGTTGSLSFEGATADAFETTIAVTDPTADRTITLPDTTGTVVTTGDTGTVTSAMIADATIVDGDISATAEIAVSKLADGSARQLLQTDAAGTGVEWTSNIDVPGTLDVTGAAVFDSSVSVTGALTKSGSNVVTVGDTGTVTSTMILDGTILNADVNASAAIAGTKISPDFGSQNTTTTGTSTAASFIPSSSTVPTNGVYLPSANNVAISTNGSERMRLDSSGRLGLGTISPDTLLHVSSATGSASPTPTEVRIATSTSASDWSTTLPWGSLSFYSADATGGARVHASINTIANGTGGGTSSLTFNTADSGVAAVERMRINATGQVGIGTASPVEELHIAAADSTIRLEDTSVSGLYHNIIAASDTGLRFDVDSGNVAASSFFRIDIDGGEKARITSDGRLGLGTSAPDALLELAANNNTPGTDPLAANNRLRFTDTDTTKVNSQTTGGIEWYTADSTDPGVYAYISSATTLAGAGWISFATGTNTTKTERVRIDQSGNVGIGTTTVSQKLHLHDGYQLITNATTGTSTGLLVGLDTGDAVISNQYAGALKFGTSNGEKARIDSSGRFLVGTSSALTNIKRYAQSIAPTQQIISNDTANWNTGLGLINYSASGYAPVLTLGLSASNTAGTNTLVSADHRCGVITFNGNDGTDFEEAARIEAFVDGTPGANDMPGRLVFSTTADGASSPTERMRITNGGYTKISNSGNYIGSTASYHEICQNANQTILWLRNSESTLSQTSNGLLITYNNAAPNGLGAYFVFCEDSVGQRFGVRSNGGVVNYSGNNVNLCDRNSKKDIAPAAGTWDCLKEWEIVNFRYKDQSDDADLNMGVIAQQIAESCPEVITVFQEATEATEDAPAKEERLGVKDQQMMWMAIKALQEAQLRIEQLEAKVAALEAS